MLPAVMIRILVCFALGGIALSASELSLWRSAKTQRSPGDHRATLPATHRDEMGFLLERHFIPGPLGYEPGDAPPAPGPRAYRTRAYSGLDSPEAKAWGAANGLGRRPAFSHNLASVFPPSLYATHPEFFPLVAGSRMRPNAARGNWNPDISTPAAAAHAAEAAAAFFAANPEADSFALGTNDALIFGESPELMALVAPAPAARLKAGSWALEGGQRSARGAVPVASDLSRLRTSSLQPPPSNPAGEANAWFRGRPDYSPLVFTFMNRVAERVAPLHPDKYLGALAYYWSENAPDFPVHPNVMPFLTADRSQGYDPAFRAEEAALQARWSRALGEAPAELGDGGSMLEANQRQARRIAPERSVEKGSGTRAPNLQPPTSNPRGAVPPRLGLYDYLYGYGFLIPRIHISLIAPYLREARRLGFTDYYAEMGPNWGLDGPQPWLVAQLLQDPEADSGALLDEYYTRYFREAAGPMRRFFEECERLWLEQPGSVYWLKHYRNESQAALFPPAACAALRRLLDDAARRAQSPEVAQRVAFVSEAFGLTERFSALHVARTALTRWALQPQAVPAEGQRLLTAYTQARAEFVAYAADLRARAPLAIHPFKQEDFLQNDPTWMAVVRLLALGTVPAQAGDPESEVGKAVRALTDQTGQRPVLPGRERVRDGGFEGQGYPAQRIAGLPYGIDAPMVWASAAEPWETMRFALDASAARSGRQGVRIAGALGASLFQWHETTAGRSHVASIRVRGRVTPSCYVTLTLTWTDEKHRTIGARTVARLPEGEWPDWVELVIGGVAPEGARAVVVGLSGQNQIDGAWAEYDEVSLIER